MVQDGYSLVRLADTVELEHFPSNVAPPELVKIPEAAIAAHCPTAGWEDGQGRYRLVQRFIDDEGDETRTHKLGAPTKTLDGNSLVVSRALVARSAAEIAAWDAEKLAADMALTCTRTQFKLAALQLGKLDAIEAFIAALDPQTHREVIIRWNESPIFYRSTPAWDAMAPQIGETPASVTALFRLALTK